MADVDIGHVVVLMMENRSYDHPRGSLRPDDHSYDGVRADDTFSNLRDPADPRSERIRLSDDGDPHLVIDPPHP